MNGIYILKSGSDFRQFSTISLDFRESPVGVEIDCVDVTKEVEPDAELEKCLEEFTGRFSRSECCFISPPSDSEEAKIEESLGKLGCDLDGRFSSVRTAETNLGNLLCDVMLASLQADCALLNAGTVRSNIKHSKGEFKLRVSRAHLKLETRDKTLLSSSSSTGLWAGQKKVLKEPDQTIHNSEVAH